MAAKKAALAADPLELDPNALASQRDSWQQQELWILQAQAKAAKAVLGLVDEMKPLAGKEEERLEKAEQKALAKAKSDVAKIGLASSTDPRLHSNPKAVETAHTYLAKQTENYITAYNNLVEHRSITAALSNQRRDCKQALESLRADAQTIVNRNLRSVA